MDPRLRVGSWHHLKGSPRKKRRELPDRLPLTKVTVIPVNCGIVFSNIMLGYETVATFRALAASAAQGSYKAFAAAAPTQQHMCSSPGAHPASFGLRTPNAHHRTAVSRPPLSLGRWTPLLHDHSLLHSWRSTVHSWLRRKTAFRLVPLPCLVMQRGCQWGEWGAGQVGDVQ